MTVTSALGHLRVEATSSLAHRTASVRIQLRDGSGAPLGGVPVTVTQTSHEFGSGCTGFDQIALANGESSAAELPNGGAHGGLERLSEQWLALFDTATLPFYWRGFELTPGHPQTERLQATARWFHDRGVTVKGHPLAWHTLAPAWLEDLSVTEVADAVLARVRRDVGDFVGLVDVWDAVNEAVIMPVFTQEPNGLTRWAARDGAVAVISAVVEAARETDPTARFVLNDFTTTPAYARLIADCLDAGVQLDAIGVQSHMHQGWWGVEKTERVLERFAAFGLPLQFTETTMVSGHLMPADIVDLNDYQIPQWPSTPEGEARQADELTTHYELLLAHPAVESVTYWGLTDDGAWLGAPAGLVRGDGSPKPAYEALRHLLREQWWLTPSTVLTDADGVVQLDGWRGGYQLTLPDRRAFDFTVNGTTATSGVTITL